MSAAEFDTGIVAEVSGRLRSAQLDAEPHLGLVVVDAGMVIDSIEDVAPDEQVVLLRSPS